MGRRARLPNKGYIKTDLIFFICRVYEAKPYNLFKSTNNRHKKLIFYIKTKFIFFNNNIIPNLVLKDN